jgi:hypothetical protein
LPGEYPSSFFILLDVSAIPFDAYSQPVVVLQWAWHEDRYRLEERVAADPREWHDEMVWNRHLASVLHHDLWPKIPGKFYGGHADEVQVCVRRPQQTRDPA